MKKLDTRTPKQRRFIRVKKVRLESLEEKIERLECEIGEVLAEFEFIQYEIEDTDKVNNQYLKELAVRYNMLSRELKKARDERDEALEEHREVKKERVNLQRKTPMYDEDLNDELLKKISDIKVEESELEKQLSDIQADIDYFEEGTSERDDAEKEIQRIESELERKREERIATRNQLVKNNMRLVYFVLNKERLSNHYKLPDDYTEDDRLQEGYVALIKAVDNYDISSGSRFSTYAYKCIWSSIMRYAFVGDKKTETTRGTLEIPASSYSKVRKLQESRGELYQQLHREPNVEDFANILTISIDKVEELLKIESMIQGDEQLSEEFTTLNGFDTISRGRTINNDGQAEEVPDYIDIPFTMAAYSELQDRIDNVLNSLADRERKVIEFRFGLLDGHPRTLKETVRELGVTRERIRQIESKTLMKLRHPSRSGRLKEFVEDDFGTYGLDSMDEHRDKKQPQKIQSMKSEEDTEQPIQDEIDPELPPEEVAEVSETVDEFDMLIRQIIEGSQELDEIIDSISLDDDDDGERK